MMNMFILKRKIRGTLGKWGIRFGPRSETAKIRKWVLPYCQGKGCDIGFGGDKIKKTDCDGIDYAKPYTHTGEDKVDIACDVINNEIPIPDNSYDYVYSSHLIEDFTDTKDALLKFIRILKSGGNLVLAFPDQPKYERYCHRWGVTANPYHIHADMGFDTMICHLQSLQGITFEVLFSSNCKIDYNVIIVLRITKL